MKLDGKVAIVTASTDGIGLAIAERLASDGAKVMISSRKQQNVDSALTQLRGKGLTVSGCVCHVANKEQRKKLIEKTVTEFGGVDILVNNAAANPYFGPILNTPESAWDKIFETNLKAPFYMTTEVVPLMEKRGGGSVVFVSSQAGYQPNEFMAAYSISKTAMLGMIKALVPELARSNIRVNGIAPSVIKTKFSKALWTSDQSDGIKSTIPLQRFATPEECAGIVSFLASSDASYITGDTVLVNGGLPARL